MAIINRLATSFNYERIDDAFDFFVVTTSDNYISGGAYLLDKPIEMLKAESVVFDSGRSAFVLFKKGVVTRTTFASSIEDEKISVKQVDSKEIKDYILFRLFLFSLNNFSSDEIKFNNITGKFYIYNTSWMDKKRRYFKALGINVDQNMCLLAEAATFSKLSSFLNKRTVADLPKYDFSNKNNSLKRVLRPENDEVYIKRSLFGMKAEIPFFDFSPKKIRKNKVYYIYKTLDLLQAKFKGLFSFEFERVDIKKTIGRSRDEKIDTLVWQIVSFKNFNLINWSNSFEYDEEFDEIVRLFEAGKLGQTTTSKSIENDAYNLVYLHNKDYYEQHKYNDPYKKFPKGSVIQHIAVEDSAEKLIDDNKAIYNTILKELLIKDDIINTKKISLDDWKSFGFKGDYVFGKEKDGIHYFMTVKQDGSFVFDHKVNNLRPFENKALNKCSDYLTDNRGKEKTVIANPDGDIIVISRTAMFSLPEKEIFSLESVSRSKESRERLLSGVVDINLYENDGKHFYSVGIQGYGMQTAIPKASHLYQVDVISGKNFIEDLMETMAVSFVKYKSFTVMPYPIKYLNEYIQLCENSKD